MRRIPRFRAAVAAAVLVGAAATLAPRDSRANGRPPATTNVRLQPGNNDVIYLPVTFGLLTSTDAGESFRWVCENAIGYGGTFDPDYAVTQDGAIYATTFKGLRVSRDTGCAWKTVGAGIPATAFLAEVEIGPDGRVWVATSTGQGPNDVYVSENGNDFVSSNLPQEKAWWVSLRTTAADPNRIYVSGFLPQQDPETPAQALLRRSDDGGQNWTELPTSGFTFGDQPRLYVLDVSPTNADVVFARVVAATDQGDALYRSVDGGLSWDKELDFGDLISAFHIRPDGQTVIAATVNGCPGDPAPDTKGCVQISRDGGDTWQLAAEQPRLACIGERSDGMLFGCGSNWIPDYFALGRSTDGETWEKVYRFSETAGPLECSNDTDQAECAALVWPSLCEMFGICAPAADAGPDPSDDGMGAGGGSMGRGGCMGAGGGAGWVAGVLFVLVFLCWRLRLRSQP